MLERYFNKKRIGRGVEIEDSIMTVTQKEEALIEKPLKRKELNLFWFFILITFFILGGRAAYLNVIKGDYFTEISKGNRVRQIVIKAPRGKIMDKFGQVLVKNIPSIDVIAIPHDLPEDLVFQEKISRELGGILDIESQEILSVFRDSDKKSLDPILIKENISKDKALILAEKLNEMGGIQLENSAIRSYENGMIFSNFIGYDGKITKDELADNSGYLMTDYIGKTGLEKSYEKELRGVPGAKRAEVDSLGQAKKNLGSIDPEPGSDLVLNIDEGLQKKLYDSLVSVLETTETKTAAAAAIDPRSGGVLAMVSLPSFDNNLFAKGVSSQDYQALISDKNLPLFNRVIKGEYPPGSTLKPAVAAAALSEGVITEDTTVQDTGMISLGSFYFRDWKTHGITDVKKAIAESCDVFFYSVGGGYGSIEGLGMNRMKKYEEMFGLGKLTGVDLPGEREGLIPSEEWKLEKKKERWYIGDSYHAAIGQGFVLATPMQLANYTAAIANGGTLYSPKIVSRIRKSNGEESVISPNVLNSNFLSPQVLRTIREGMKQTVESGTSQSLKELPVSAAGKTGTAQFGTEDKTHAWFISFAPYDNPQIAMVVLVEGGGEGHSSAVPVTKDVYDYYFSR